MRRMIDEEKIVKVARKGRKLLGIVPDHYKRLGRLRFTAIGTLSLAAVGFEALERGIASLEAETKKKGLVAKPTEDVQ